MSVVRAGEIRGFILEHLGPSFRDNGLADADIGDDFDLMKRGIIDSIGVIQLLSAIEERFGIEVDYEDMDTDTITVIGPICRYIEERAKKS